MLKAGLSIRMRGFAERWMSGLSRTPGKRVQGNTLTGVRIPPSPPNQKAPAGGIFICGETLNKEDRRRLGQSRLPHRLWGLRLCGVGAAPLWERRPRRDWHSPRAIGHPKPHRPGGGPPTTSSPKPHRPGGGPPTTPLWERRPRRDRMSDMSTCQSRMVNIACGPGPSSLWAARYSTDLRRANPSERRGRKITGLKRKAP